MERSVGELKERKWSNNTLATGMGVLIYRADGVDDPQEMEIK